MLAWLVQDINAKSMFVEIDFIGMVPQVVFIRSRIRITIVAVQATVHIHKVSQENVPSARIACKQLI